MNAVSRNRRSLARGIALASGLPIIITIIAGLSTAAAAEAVSLTVSPLSSISTTVVVTSALGNDADGPEAAAVTGTAEASLATTVDPTFGRVATSLQLGLSELAIADTSFDLFVVIPIAISIEGAEARFTLDVLSPGTPVAANTADFDLLPLELEYTAGEVVVLEPPGIPLENTFLDLMGEAQVETVENGGFLDVTITIPIQDTTTTTESGFTVELITDGTIVLEGTTPIAAPVPTLQPLPLGMIFLAVLFLGWRRTPGFVPSTGAR
jgi:hypothetical protein